MDINRLNEFITLATLLNYSKAAQPALSDTARSQPSYS